jgi:hypothetical protein
MNLDTGVKAMNLIQWTTRCLLVGSVLCAANQSARAQFHEGDISVGRSAAGQLKVSNVPFVPPDILNPVSGLLNGFADNNPGFDRIDTDQPGSDFFQLQSGAQITLRMISVDPAFKVWRNNLSGNLDSPGEEFPIGDFQLHYHPTWHIDSTTPGYDAARPFWEATFVLIDTGTTGYTQSDAFTVRFANRANSIPTISEWGLAIMVLALLSVGTLVLRSSKWKGVSP